MLDRLLKLGTGIDTVTQHLVDEGVQEFGKAFDELMEALPPVYWVLRAEAQQRIFIEVLAQLDACRVRRIALSPARYEFSDAPADQGKYDSSRTLTAARQQRTQMTRKERKDYYATHS